MGKCSIAGIVLLLDFFFTVGVGRPIKGTGIIINYQNSNLENKDIRGCKIF